MQLCLGSGKTTQRAWFMLTVMKRPGLEPIEAKKARSSSGHVPHLLIERACRHTANRIQQYPHGVLPGRGRFAQHWRTTRAPVYGYHFNHTSSCTPIASASLRENGMLPTRWREEIQARRNRGFSFQAISCIMRHG